MTPPGQTGNPKYQITNPKTTNHNKQNNSYYQGNLSLLVSSILAKNLVLECFYRVCQKMTYQLLKQLIYLGGVKEMSLSSHVEIISNQLT